MACMAAWLTILCLAAAACQPLTDLPEAHPLVAATQAVDTPAETTQSPATPVLPASPTFTATPADTATPTATPQPQIVRFAVIGDYGEGNQGEADVANMIKGWNPDLVITTGDNNYPDGSAATIDQRIGEYYHEFIYPYHGAYGQGADQNRFFPTLGNHDWMTANAQPYLDYFELPGNERYYDFSWGDVHFFALDADSREPDGVSQVSPQADWLRAQLKASTSTWNVVYFHQAAYSSGMHGSTDWMRWPFAEWGASVVFMGHDHTYERLIEDGIPYFVDGIGGGPIYDFSGSFPGSQAQYNQDYGALLVSADGQQMTFQFFSRSGQMIDSYQISKTQ